MKQSLMITAISLMLAACSKEKSEVFVQQAEYSTENLIYNASFEEGNAMPLRWSSTVTGEFTSERTNQAASHDQYSLKVGNERIVGLTEFVYVGQSIVPEAGKKYRMSLSIKTDKIAGRGISYAIRGDSPTEEFVYITSLHGSPNGSGLTGTKDWTEYVITTDEIPESITKLWVFCMMLPETTGSAYFDDVHLFEAL